MTAVPITIGTIRRSYRRSDFVPAPGSRIRKSDARIIGSRFATIYKDRKALTRELVVEDAMKKSSPLNRFFEWDKTKAAMQYWLERAGYLLRSVWVRVIIEKKTAGGTRSFMPDYSRDGQYYPSPIAFSNVDASTAIVQAARRELEGWIKRYERYSALSGAVTAAKEVLKKL